jgi:hypothetical protein
MTALDVLQRTVAHRPAAERHLTLCEDCTAALLHDLEALFPTRLSPRPLVMGRAQIMGCTFEPGTQEQCMLHDTMETA